MRLCPHCSQPLERDETSCPRCGRAATSWNFLEWFADQRGWIAVCVALAICVPACLIAYHVGFRMSTKENQAKIRAVRTEAERWISIQQTRTRTTEEAAYERGLRDGAAQAAKPSAPDAPTAALTARETRPGTIPLDEAEQWQWTGKDVWVGHFAIQSDVLGAAFDGPDITVRARNNSDEPQRIGVSVLLFDSQGRIVTAACLKPGMTGILTSREADTMSEALPISMSQLRSATHVWLSVNVW